MKSALLLVVALLLTQVSGAAIQRPTATAADYFGIDPAVATAWERAGATVTLSREDRPRFTFRPGEAPSPGDLANLPQPGVPFSIQFERVLTAAHIGALKNFVQLRELNCERSDPAILGPVAELSRLESARFVFLDQEPSPDQLALLSKLPALRSLGLIELDVTDAVLKELASLQRLHVLDLTGSTLTDAQLSQLTALKELQRLDVSQTDLTGRGFGALAALSNLKRLDLGSSAITDALLAELPKLSQLEALWLWNGTRLSAGEPAALAQMTRLRHLALYYPNSFSDDWIATLSRLQSLESLELYFTDQEKVLTDVGLAQFKRFPRLQSLYLYGAQISNAGLQALAEVKSLRQLDLNRTPSPVTDQGMKTVATKLNLEGLGIHAAITDEGLAPLAGMGSLTHLRVPANPARKAVTSDGLRRLASARPGLQINRLPAAKYIESLQIGEALQTVDPEARLVALEALRSRIGPADARRVDEAMLSTLGAKWKNQAERVGPVFDRVIASIPSGSTPIARLTVVLAAVEPFADSAVYADRVEAALTRALDGFSSAPPLQGLNEPKSRASGLALLGRARLAAGRIAEARRATEQSLELMPLGSNRGSALLVATLAQIKVRQGDTAGALDAYLSAASAVVLTPAQEAELRALYKSVHGSVAALDAAIARRHRELFPNPISPVRYIAPANPTGRVVLIELMTGSGCGPCVRADQSFEALLERYPGDAVVGVAYHQHIPMPDPMVVPGSDPRLSYYKRGGVPQAFVDGGLDAFKTMGELPAGSINWDDRPSFTNQTYQSFIAEIDGRLKMPPAASLSVAAAGEGNQISVRANVGKLPPGRDLRLQLLLVEREVGFSGENGIRNHMMTVRAIAGGATPGLKLTGEGPVSHRFDLDQVRADVATNLEAEILRRRKNGNRAVFAAEGRAATSIDTSQLSVVAFIQEGAYVPGKANVLQAAQAPVVFKDTRK